MTTAVQALLTRLWTWSRVVLSIQCSTQEFLAAVDDTHPRGSAAPADTNHRHGSAPCREGGGLAYGSEAASPHWAHNAGLEDARSRHGWWLVASPFSAIHDRGSGGQCGSQCK